MKIKLFSEYIGTLYLLLIIVGSGLMGESLTDDQALVLLANSLATFLGLVTLIWIFSPYSGAHFNPLVSIMLFVLGEIPLLQTIFYIIFQISGGISGVIFTNIIFDVDFISISAKERLTVGTFISEIIATFGLLMTILLLKKKNTNLIAPAVGMYIGAAYWFTSSTSFANPAVTLSRTLSNTFTGIIPTDVLPFIFAQFIGLVFIYIVYKSVYE